MVQKVAHLPILKTTLVFITLALQVSMTMGITRTLAFTQKLDHFGYYEDLHDATFQQRVVVNDALWAGAEARAPIFVLLGDENSQNFDPSSFGILSLCAKEFQAMLIYIEHRFYGESLPLGSIELAMADHQVRGCLTTNQALEDAAVIIQTLKADFSSMFSPVIVVGTGYGGALAAWFRIKYPQIAVGALASSTPMYYFGNTTQPTEYCSIVSQDFKDVNELCYESIQKSWEKINDIATQPNGLEKLSTTFNTCRQVQSNDEIKDMLSQFFSLMAQFHDPMDHYLSSFCSQIESGTIEAIVHAIYMQLMPRDCLNTDITGFNTPFEPVSNLTVAWAWQQCSELVFPVGCGDNTMLPSKAFNFTTFKQSCHERFGIVPEPQTPISVFARENMVESLAGFGGNIIFSNGLRDPFSSGGILEDLSNSIIAITTKRGTYAAETIGIKDDDPDWLRELREEEVKIFRSWINQYNHVKKSHLSIPHLAAYLVLAIILIIIFVAFLVICYYIFRSMPAMVEVQDYN